MPLQTFESITGEATPWHQDAPYCFVEGAQLVSFRLPLDPVGDAQTLKRVAGSHALPGPVRPAKWLDDSDFHGLDRGQYMDPPAIAEASGAHAIRAWPRQPGDAALSHFRTRHDAAGNELPGRRRAFSVRRAGNGVRCVERPGRTSPPFPGYGMRRGERLREDRLPALWPGPLENPASGTH